MDIELLSRLTRYCQQRESEIDGAMDLGLASIDERASIGVSELRALLNEIALLHDQARFRDSQTEPPQGSDYVEVWVATSNRWDIVRAAVVRRWPREEPLWRPLPKMLGKVGQ